MNSGVKTQKHAGGRPKKPRTPIPDTSSAPVAFDTEGGLTAAIRRLRLSEIQSSQAYQASLLTKDAALISMTNKTWLAQAEQLRKMESTTPDVQRANSEMLPVVVVEYEVARMCNAFRVALEALPRSLPQKLVGLDFAGVEEVLKGVLNDTLALLHTDKWSKR